MLMKHAVAALVCCLRSAPVIGFAPSAFITGTLPRDTPQNHVVTRLDMASRRPFISGNWKLNPQSREEAVALASGIAASITSDSPDADVALFVPYVFIEAAMNAVGGKLQVGAEVSKPYCVTIKRFFSEAIM